MMRQIKILTRLELANIFSLNVLRHTRDKKAKRTSVALGITIVAVIVLLMLYCGAMSYSFIKLGAESIVPSYIVFLSSIFILLFCAFKAGKIIFKESCYDILTSMPISKSALVISRYIRLYVEGLAVALVVMVPGIIVYSALVKPGAVAIVLGAISILLVPVIPVTLSALLGLVITGISSRMKHKALFEAVVAIVFVVAIFGATSIMPTTEAGDLDINAIESVARDLFDTIENVYPPTAWFGNALGAGNVIGFLIGALVSVGLLIAVVAITALNFEGINRRLHITSAKHDYKLGELQNRSMMKALVAREAKRYFSSGTYVTNTIMGPVMAVIFAASMLFIELEVAFEGLPVTINIDSVAPILFAAILVLNSPIVTSISMEGKELWIIRTLPVSDRDILRSKLVFNIALLAPFYLVGELLMIIALRPTLPELFWMIILPVVLVLCGLVVGLAVNLKFPKLKWDSDVEVVKQSASALIGGFGGVLIALVAAIPILLVPVKYYNLAVLAVCVVVAIITAAIYEKNNSFDLKQLC